jgi:WASH complex subunit 7
MFELLRLCHNICSLLSEAAGEIQLRNYGKCLDDYSIKLQRIEDTLDESVNNSWDLSVDPAVVESSPAEHCTLVQLIDTDNKILNKVLIALAATCAEIEFLQVEAKTKYFTAILFYGEGKIWQISILG